MPVKKYLLLLIMITAPGFIHKTKAQSAVKNHPAEQKRDTSDLIEPIPPDGFSSFIFKNLHLKHTDPLPTKVLISFKVNTNGSLSDFNMLKDLGEENNKEVVRVLKLSPKWKPAKKAGKHIPFTYTLPVTVDWATDNACRH